MFWGLLVYCACNMNWAAASWIASLPYQSNPLPLSLQLVCNQGNHSVVKTTNLFLQYNQPLGVRVWLPWISHGISCYVVVVRLYTTCMRMTCVGAWNVVEFQIQVNNVLLSFRGSKEHFQQTPRSQTYNNHYQCYYTKHRGREWPGSKGKLVVNAGSSPLDRTIGRRTQ